jgi:hypothetical protein
MIKNDRESLERLAFDIDERDIANFKAILSHLRSKDMLTITDRQVDKALNAIDAIGKLRLSGRIYAFHVYDSYADGQGGPAEGVELYKRYGDTLKDYYVPGSRDFCYQIEEASAMLRKKDIRQIYTGEIRDGRPFLGLKSTYDSEDPVTLSILQDYEIIIFKKQGIKVVSLDELI